MARRAFSPDGKALCFTARDAKPVIYQLPRLGCAAWPSSASPVAVTIVEQGLRSRGQQLVVRSDSATIYLTRRGCRARAHLRGAGCGGRAKLVVDATQGVYTNVQTAARGASPGPLPTGRAPFVRPRSSAIDPSTGNRTFLTSFTTATAESIDWQPLREFWFTGRDGRRIHNFVALPPNFDETKKYPLFVLIHGGHANMWRDSITYRWNYHLLAQPGFVVLLTDYRGSTGYGEKFTLDILGDPLAGPADDINDAADEAIKQFAFIDGTPAGSGRRKLWRPSHELAGRHDDAVSLPRQPRRSRDARDAVGHQRRHLSPRADDGWALLGEPAEVDRAEPAGQGGKFQDADAALGRR